MNYDERLDQIREGFEKVSQKAADVYGDTQAAFELGQEVLDAKLKDIKGDAVAAQETIRLAAEKSQRHLASQVIKAQMTLEAKAEDIKNAVDKKKLEKYIDNRVVYLSDLYDTINYLLVDAEATAIETLSAIQEYNERFGGAEEETDAQA